MSTQAAEYTKNTILTAGDLKLVVLMYEGAIRFLWQASFHLEQKNTAACGAAISRAYDVVSELRLALDLETGEAGADAISLDLNNLYSYLMEQLVAANVSREADVLESVREIIETLKEGWDGLLAAA